MRLLGIRRLIVGSVGVLFDVIEQMFSSVKDRKVYIDHYLSHLVRNHTILCLNPVFNQTFTKLDFEFMTSLNDSPPNSTIAAMQK